MYLLKIDLKHSLDLTSGPTAEEIWFDSVEEIQSAFKFFPFILIKDHKVYRELEKDKLFQVGEILMGEAV